MLFQVSSPPLENALSGELTRRIFAIILSTSLIRYLALGCASFGWTRINGVSLGKRDMSEALRGFFDDSMPSDHPSKMLFQVGSPDESSQSSSRRL